MVISTSSVPRRGRHDKVQRYKEGARVESARRVSLTTEEVLRDIDEVLDSAEEEDVD